MGLAGNSYGTVWSNLLATKPLLSLNRVYFDSRRMSQEHGEFIAFAAQASFKSKGQGETQTECDVHTLYAIGT